MEMIVCLILLLRLKNTNVLEFLKYLPFMWYSCIDSDLFVLVTSRYIIKNIYVTHLTKKDLTGIAKSIDSGQPAQSAQSDRGKNLSLLADFLCIKVPIAVT